MLKQRITEGVMVGVRMKFCDYCGRESDARAVRCQECGTAFADSAPSVSEAPTGHRPGLAIPSSVAAGVAVVLICTGVVLATKMGFPWLYAFGLFFDLWLAVLVLLATSLSFYAGTICYNSQWHRAVFTFAVLAFLGVATLGFQLGGKFGAESPGPPVVTYATAAVLAISGTAILVWIARKLRQAKTSCG